MFSTVFAASAASNIEVGRILLELALIVCAAKVVAECAERINIPPVLGEIALGLAIGPSALNLVHRSDSILLLAELGAILLLLQVGMEMNVPELRTVGHTAVTVAVAGVVLPLIAGTLGGLAFGENGRTSLFIGSTLTATSVGITARVFGDLRALATKEARIVLGAAVADDVLGLIILTIVTRIAERGSIGVGTVVTTSAVAISFVAISAVVGFTAIPALLRLAIDRSTSPAVASVIAVGLALAFAGLADTANLAPIIGAFVVGTSLTRAPAHERISRDVSAIASVFVPVFFVNIGIDTDIGALTKPHVLGLVAAFTAIAAVTKIAAGFTVRRRNVDRLIVGLGMMPRGEVGLIFAAIGLGANVLDPDWHAALVLVVLATTVISPWALRRRIEHSRPPTIDPDVDTSPEPPSGWLEIESNRIELTVKPPVSASPDVILGAALLAREFTPSDNLMEWISDRRTEEIRWEPHSTEKLLELLRKGNARSWRFLEACAFFERTLPIIAREMKRRPNEIAELDPSNAVRFPAVEALREATSVASTQSNTLLLAAFLSDVDDNGASTKDILAQLSLDPAMSTEIDELLKGARVLRAAVASEPHNVGEKRLHEIAHGLRRPGIVERSRLLADAIGGLELWQHAAMIDVTTQVQVVLAQPELLDEVESSLADLRKRQATALLRDTSLIGRINNAPTNQVLAFEPDELAKRVELLEPAPRGREVRVSIEPALSRRGWTIHVVCCDRSGLLSRLAGVLTDSGLAVRSASLATWPDGVVLDTFEVGGQSSPDADELKRAMHRALRGPVRRRRLDGGAPTLELDNSSHPWHSLLRFSGDDRSGFLAAVSYALSKAGVVVHHASINTSNGLIDDTFEVSDRSGHRVSDVHMARLRHILGID